MVGQSLIGLATLLVFAWGLSENRAAIRWRPVVGGMVLALVMAVALLKLPFVAGGFLLVNHAIEALQAATDVGTGFVFGYLGGAPLPFVETHPGAAYVLAFRALPLVLVISALSRLLFHWGLLQGIVAGFSWILRRSLGIGGALGVSSAANIFVGMIESPLLIRPYLKRLQRGELFAVMTVGMAGIAGTMMVIYATILKTAVPGALGHILVSSVISAPAALAVSALMVPFSLTDTTEGDFDEGDDRPTSAVDAIARGTAEGLGLLLNIVAMLVVLVSLVTLFNSALGLLPEIAGAKISLQRLFGLAFAPYTWLLGVPWEETQAAGALMGTKTVLNEFLAYLDLSRLPEEALSPRSRLIMTYALCGFANFGSLGIMIGGMGSIAPERKAEIVNLGFKSILAGTLATSLGGGLVGLLTAAG